MIAALPRGDLDCAFDLVRLVVRPDDAVLALVRVLDLAALAGVLTGLAAADGAAFAAAGLAAAGLADDAFGATDLGLVDLALLALALDVVVRFAGISGLLMVRWWTDIMPVR